MSLARQFRAVETPKVGKPAKEPAKPKRSGARRGPKATGKAKVLLTLRLHPETVAKFKAAGKGWQSRMSDILDRAEP